MFLFWFGLFSGLLLIAVGAVTAFRRVLPAPTWLWGERDAATGEPVPAVRASGAGSIAMGVGVVALAWPGSVAVRAAGVLLVGWALVLHLRAARLRTPDA